jgi:hypothetical protein
MLNPKSFIAPDADGIHMKDSLSASTEARGGSSCGGVPFVVGLGGKKMMTDDVRRIAITINHANKIESSTMVKGITISAAVEQFLQRYLQDGTFSLKVEQLCPDGRWRKI